MDDEAGKAVTNGCFGALGVTLFFICVLLLGAVGSMFLCAGGVFFTGRAIQSSAATAEKAEKDANAIADKIQRNARPAK